MYIKSIILKTLIFYSAFISIANASEKIFVFVSIIPQQYFVEKIGGQFVEVSVMVEPGAGPATYEPKPKQMAGLSKAKIYYAVGVPFENVWLNKIASANPDMKIIYTQQGVEKIAMQNHNHSKDHNHKNFIKDPHIWLSPPLVMIQARNILTALIDTDPVNKTIYEQNYKKFINEILDLDFELRNIFANNKNSSFMVFHPAWGYFAQAYNLKQIPVEIEGKEPKPAKLKNLIKNAKTKKIKAIFVQPQFSTKSAEVIANSIGGKIISVDSLAFNWSDNLKNAGLKFKNALTHGDE